MPEEVYTVPKPSYTRAQMEAIIDGGGGVIHNSVVIIDKNLLPSEADIAKGDPEKEQAVADQLQAKIDELQSQLNAVSQQNQEKEVELETLKVSELRAKAKAAGVENADTLTKADLLTALGSTP